MSWKSSSLSPSPTFGCDTNCKRNFASVVRELAKRHDVNAIWQQATPLLMAVGHAAHFQVADLLLKAGASPNVGTSLVHVHFHFEHLVRGLHYLAGVGWNVNSCDSEGQTALHKAALAGYAAAIRALIELRADAGARDSGGLTPLDIAHIFNKRAAIKALARAA